MTTQNKIVSTVKAIEMVKKWKAEGEKIVFTNGCFDILHLGHVDYLEKAAALGTKMVVGLNTDESVSCIKPGRPIQDNISRSRIIASLTFVDLVVFFGEQTPLNLISAILPHILVKGDDYTIETIVGSDIVIKNGGEVKTIQLVNGYSTTNIVNKIKNLNS
jgi:D-glycero-beta-D-manno-heptose 1-phosphate adenylyltransferase